MVCHEFVYKKEQQRGKRSLKEVIQWSKTKWDHCIYKDVNIPHKVLQHRDDQPS